MVGTVGLWGAERHADSDPQPWAIGAELERACVLPGPSEDACSPPLVSSQGHLSTLKGSRALSGPEGSLEGVDLSLTGLPPPMNRRPNSASATKPITRSISVVTGSEPRRKMLVSIRAGCHVWGLFRAPCLGVASDSWRLRCTPQQAPSCPLSHSSLGLSGGRKDSG